MDYREMAEELRKQEAKAVTPPKPLAPIPYQSRAQWESKGRLR